MTKLAPKFLFFSFLLLIAYIPFHGFISTWIISENGNELRYKAWKEVLIILMLVVAFNYLSRHRDVLKKLAERRINQVIVVYGLLHLIVALFTDQTLKAFMHGMVINLRFLAIFLLAQVIVEIYKSDTVKRLTIKTLLVVSTIISALVILQILLPKEFLQHFGYGEDTIPTYFTIDRNLEYIRYASTTRGPNVLGAYLILPVTTLTAFFFVKRNWRKIAQTVLMLFALLMTFSRSAWLGLLASVGIYKIYFSPKKIRDTVRKLLPVLLIFVAIFIAVFSTTDFIQHTVFHQDPDDLSDVINSTDEHWEATKAGVEDVISNPLGSGVGTAGPASRSNDKPARISENYFVQVGQEVGVVGLALFIWINVLLAQALLHKRDEEIMKPVLFSALIGLTVVSMLLHGWADEEVAITYWGIAGLYLNS